MLDFLEKLASPGSIVNAQLLNTVTNQYKMVEQWFSAYGQYSTYIDGIPSLSIIPKLMYL